MTEAAGSGTFQVVRTLAGGSLARGHEVHLALGRRPETPDADRAGLPEGVDITWLPWERRTPAAQLRAARALRRVADAVQPDIVHLHSAFAGAVGAVTLAHRFPTIYTPHGAPVARTGDPLPVRLAIRLAERAVATRCDALGAVSQAEAALARRAIGARRVFVVPNGLPELDDPPAPEPRSGRPAVVAMGRIGRARRPAETACILAAVADVADVAWVGASPDGEDAPVHAAGVPVTGWVDRDEALRRLASATAYLHWSAWDGLSLAVLEALARDVVVIASDIPANREVLGPGQVFRRPEDAIALLREVVGRADTRARLLDAQRARRSRWGAEVMVDGWIAAYRRLLAPPDAGVRSSIEADGPE